MKATLAPHSESRDEIRSIRRYFLFTFAASWTGALLVAVPHLLRGEAVPRFAGLMMFPVMLLGPAICGVAFGGLGVLRRITHPFPIRWLAVLLLPPALIASMLSLCTLAVSHTFTPNHFFVGLSFGLAAGFLEEIGWSGYAFPAMSQQRSGFRAAVLLGALWSLWHLPVIDYLGTVTPHRSWWSPYFLAFAAVMIAMRVLICWTYARTGSLLLTQLLHAASTGSLVALSPPGVTAAQECAWYVAYAGALWLVVALVRGIAGPTFTRGLRPTGAVQVQ